MENESQADEAQPSLEERRIHVLGIGNIGLLFAHSLARLSNRPPITLLFHRPSLVTEFEEAGETIEIITNGTSNKQFGFDYEVVGAEGAEEQSGEPIYNLILATKATRTLRALSSIKHRLGPQSTILFTQNGLGTTSSLSSLFPTPSSQPSYLTAVIFHGIYSAGPFSSIHAGVGYLHIAPTSISPSASITTSISSSPTTSPSPPSLQYLLTTTLTLPTLNALEAGTPLDLLTVQLEKLAINAIINPLTALFRIRNGALYSLPALADTATGLIRTVLAETSNVILALPELSEAKAGRATRKRFAVDALAGLVREKALLTAGNRSSMLQDVEGVEGGVGEGEEGKRETEIAFINGWVVRRGRELGVDVRVNERIVELVEAGRVVRVEEVGEVFGL